MRILWCTIDRSMRVARHFDALQNAVSRLADVVFIRKSTEGLLAREFGVRVMSGKTRTEETLVPLLDASEMRYDFIMCDAVFAFPRDRWREVTVPKAVLLEDLHGSNPAEQVRLCLKNEIDVVFHRYNLSLDAFHSNLRESRVKCTWLPHAANLQVFKRYGKKSLDILMVGVTASSVYPHRAKTSRLLGGKPYFHKVARPPETRHHAPKYPVGRDYAELLSSAKICITCGSIYHYPVMKFFEIPACGSLLISDWFPELEMLGFKPDWNMVVADLDNLPKQVEWWLSHDEERRRVSDRGAELVRKYHSTEIRAKQLLNHLCMFLGRKPMFELEFDFYSAFGNG